ncbi:hypothetical protein [Glutamicibacter arilaitensis]|uniref:hypothetical protein n=1 Tax=Glutamicibacter arilaitensis TaxID=256701 RepID=UPI003FD08D53
MTWAKYGNEFFDQLFDVDFPEGLEDACALTHTQALHYLYSVEEMAMTFPKSALRRFASSSEHVAAAAALVAAGLWADQGARFQVLHHEDVFRQSLAAQLTKRDRDKKHQRRKRGGSVAGGVANGVANDNYSDNDNGTANDIGATQSVSQSFRQALINEVPKNSTLNQNKPTTPVADPWNDSAPVDPWLATMPAGRQCSVDGCDRRVTEYSAQFGQYCAGHGEELGGRDA